MVDWGLGFGLDFKMPKTNKGQYKWITVRYVLIDSRTILAIKRLVKTPLRIFGLRDGKNIRQLVINKQRRILMLKTLECD